MFKTYNKAIVEIYFKMNLYTMIYTRMYIETAKE